MIQTQRFADGPRLKRTTAWSVGWLGVGDFRNVAEAGFLKMREDWRQKLAARLAFGFVRIAANTHPRLDERTNQPRPDRALVIGAVALAHASSVMRCVARFARCERTQA